MLELQLGCMRRTGVFSQSHKQQLKTGLTLPLQSFWFQNKVAILHVVHHADNTIKAVPTGLCAAMVQCTRKRAALFSMDVSAFLRRRSLVQCFHIANSGHDMAYNRRHVVQNSADAKAV